MYYKMHIFCMTDTLLADAFVHTQNPTIESLKIWSNLWKLKLIEHTNTSRLFSSPGLSLQNPGSGGVSNAALRNQQKHGVAYRMGRGEGRRFWGPAPGTAWSACRWRSQWPSARADCRPRQGPSARSARGSAWRTARAPLSPATASTPPGSVSFRMHTRQRATARMHASNKQRMHNLSGKTCVFDIQSCRTGCSGESSRQ